MKRFLTICMIMIMGMCVLAGCGSAAQKKEESSSAEDSGKLKIMTVMFPEYDWTRNILGDSDRAEVSILLENGVDLHSYQPSAEDMMKISSCDLLIYGGGISEQWIRKLVENPDNKDLHTVCLMDVLGDGVKNVEIIQGMQPEEEEEHSGDEEEAEEHVWLSVRNAEQFTDAIAKAIAELDPEGQSVYEANAAAYEEKLKDLDARYQETVDGGKRKVVLFGDRFPFRYLMDDYGLEYYAAFPGCSAETEASFETVAFLAGKVEELGLTSVLTIENSNDKLAKTIISSTKTGDQKILSLDSIQAVTREEAESGETYLGIMEKNLEVLKEALN